jgi:superfamily II DNA or RNA helicase
LSGLNIKAQSKASWAEFKPKHPAAARLARSGFFERIKRFRDLEKKISELVDIKTIGDAFEVFAEAYFATQKISGAKPGSIRPLDKVPAELAKTLRIPQKDYGIDGIYEDDLPGYKAYQVKFRSGRPSLTWDELSTFFGLSDSSAIHTKVVFTNCDNISEVVNERPRFLAVRGNDLDRLTEADFKQIEAWLQGSIVKHARKSPRPHQEEAIHALFQSLLKEDRTTGIMACATGKTLVALWTVEKWMEHLGKANAKDVNQGKILVLLPSLALLRQTLHEWLRETRYDPISYMAVCSDPTVGNRKDDHLEVKQSELDFEVTTDSGHVRRWLGAQSVGPKIIFSTYQSAHVIAEAMKPGESWDIAPFDEAHKTAGREGKSFAFALEDKNIRIKKRFFLTATPRHYNPVKKDKDGESTLVFSMNNPKVYGPIVHTLTFAKAAELGIICRYKVLVSIVNTKKVDDFLLQKGESRVGGDDVRARQIANQISIQYAHEKHRVKKIFTFHKSIASAKDFTSDSSQGIKTHLPEFSCFHVSGEMPTARRDKLIENFRDADKAIMSNARCLTEGVDVPAVDMVAFLSPRRSHIDIVQATGRTMRRAPGKEVGYILLPLYIQMAEGEDVEEAVERTGFDEVWDVLGALQEQDEVLADILRKLAEEKGRGKGYDDQSRLKETVEFVTPFVFLGDLKRAISVRCVDKLLPTWDMRLAEAVQFYKDNQRWPKKAAGQIGSWCAVQRTKYWTKDSALTQERIAKLNAAGFDWGEGNTDLSWDERFQQAVQFYKDNGEWPGSNDGPIGRWAVWQQVLHRTKNTALTQERIAKLNAVGFDWGKPRGSLLERLDEYIQRAEAFYAKTGTWRNFSKADVVGAVNKIRDYKSDLSPEHIKRLEKIEFPMESLLPGTVEAVEAHLQTATAYYKNNGGWDRWTRDRGAQRAVSYLQSNKQKLTDAQLQQCEAINFPWGRY